MGSFGKIPAHPSFGEGKDLRFSPELIDEWAKNRALGVCRNIEKLRRGTKFNHPRSYAHMFGPGFLGGLWILICGWVVYWLAHNTKLRLRYAGLLGVALLLLPLVVSLFLGR